MSLRPKLRQDLVLVEQSYRGEQSFIVKDPESRKYFRFRPVEIKVMLTLGCYSSLRVSNSFSGERAFNRFHSSSNSADS